MAIAEVFFSCSSCVDHSPAESRFASCALITLVATRTARLALGRKSWLFAGSERGADRAAIMATLIMTKLNDIDPQAWLADALARIASTPQGELNELLPWKWKNTPVQPAA